MIKEFTDGYIWLSNFWLSPVVKDGRVYPSVENAYQASKFPKEERSRFVSCSAGKAKGYGRGAKLPENWDDEKIPTMKRLLRQKFRIGTYNSVLLIATGEKEIIEGNSWGDIFWGVCDGAGENNLGILIMEIREELRIKTGKN